MPFGEYVPLKQLLFFVGAARRGGLGLLAGRREAVLLPVGGHLVSTAICYEVVYPEPGPRSSSRSGSELLTTITNDAWFGRSSAPYQHFEQASMRAIEEGRYLVRAANTGISGIVDPYGRVLQRSNMFESAVMVEDVRFLTDATIYSRIGDVVGWLSVALTLRALLAARDRDSRRRLDMMAMLQLDELIRRYQDLAKRAADLRSYL